MIKTLAKVAGVVFLALGALSFVPAVTHDGTLFNLLAVNQATSIVYLLTGAVALWAGWTSTYASRMYFQVSGVVYGVLAIMGFFAANGEILNVIANNQTSTLFHTVIAVASLGIGFAMKDEEVPTTAPRS